MARYTGEGYRQTHAGRVGCTAPNGIGSLLSIHDHITVVCTLLSLLAQDVL